MVEGDRGSSGAEDLIKLGHWWRPLYYRAAEGKTDIRGSSLHYNISGNDDEVS